MFTGIIEEVGSVKSILRGSKSIKLSINCERIMDDIKIGDSIAVNGICLTVTEIGNKYFLADVMPETMRKTNLDKLNFSDSVNLERAMKVSNRFGGHIVSGHIDGTGVLCDKHSEDNATWLTIEAPDNILRYIVMKGSICLDGTSLTVAFIDKKSFKVSLIPLTSSITTLGKKGIGDKINIECDVIAKYVEKLVCGKVQEENTGTGLTMEFLKENGF